MQRLFAPVLGPTDWRRLLANPQRQWREGKSAYELAVAWEAARSTERGLPPEVAAILDQTEEFAGATLVLGIPEHQVHLDGGGHASQTDLWALLCAQGRLVSVAIEAKARENFDRLVPEWLASASPRSQKPQRLRQVGRILGLTREQANLCRYQLLHRPVAAIREAKRFALRDALFLVQSFAKDEDGLSDYLLFARQLGVEAEEDRIVPAGVRGGIRLWIGWLTCEPADNRTARAALA